MRYSGGLFRAGGLLVSVIGFALTRLVVAEAISLQSGLAYLLSGLVPLALGLSLTVFGVALAVGAYSAYYVRKIAIWTTAGTVAFAVVLSLSSFESLLTGTGFAALGGNPLLVANVLLTGAIGGVVIGHRTATNGQQREANKRQANRALLLDRILRHEVINAVTIIRGYAEIIPETDSASTDTTPILTASDRISTTINDVAELIEEGTTVGKVDIAQVVSSRVAKVRGDYDNLEIEYEGPSDDVVVAGDSRFERIVSELIKFASLDPDCSSISLKIEERDLDTRLVMTADGGSLREDHRELLNSGTFPKFDDPSSGFSLPIIRLLVREYGGTIRVPNDSEQSGKRISIDIPKADYSKGVRAINVTGSQLVWAALSGLFAGVIMGGYFVMTTDLFPIIGALYGVENRVVGWTTHLFHSVVFAVIFAGALSHPRIKQFASTPRKQLISGLAWSIILWMFAAGILMPVWLTVLGIPAEFPNLPTLGLISHLLWGAVLGATYPTLSHIELFHEVPTSLSALTNA